MSMKSNRNISSTTRIEPLEARTMLSGSTISDFQLASGKGAGALAVVEDSADNLFVAATANDAAGVSHALVNEFVRRADGSVGPATTVVDFNLSQYASSGWTSEFSDLLIDPATGDLYAAGQSKDAAGISHWVLVKRDATGSVSTVEDYQYPGGSYTAALGITRDAAGNIFVAGEADTTIVVKHTSSTISHWIVRELKANTSAWVAAEDFTYQGQSTYARDIIAAPSGLYVTGFGGGHWLTRRGAADAAGNIVWATVDDFKADPNYSSLAQGLGTDANGNVYSLGTAVKSNCLSGKQAGSVQEWTVRRTSNGGGSWLTIDSARGAGSGTAAAQGFGSDASGNLYAVGYLPGSDNSAHQVVRTLGINDSSWATLDDWQLAPGHGAFGSGLLADHAGSVYAVGNANDAANIRHAIVRRIDTPASAGNALFSLTPVTAFSVDQRSDLNDLLS